MASSNLYLTCHGIKLINIVIIKVFASLKLGLGFLLFVFSMTTLSQLGVFCQVCLENGKWNNWNFHARLIYSLQCRVNT